MRYAKENGSPSDVLIRDAAEVSINEQLLPGPSAQPPWPPCCTQPHLFLHKPVPTPGPLHSRPLSPYPSSLTSFRFELTGPSLERPSLTPLIENGSPVFSASSPASLPGITLTHLSLAGLCLCAVGSRTVGLGSVAVVQRELDREGRKVEGGKGGEGRGKEGGGKKCGKFLSPK